MPATWNEIVIATYITDISDVVALQELLKDGKVSAEDVVLAYIQK
jgi:hypothetical protein